MRKAQLPLFRLLLVLLCVPALLALNGCNQAFNAAAGGAGSGLAIQGKLYGGQQPVVGAQIYLYAASTAGYGSASTSLLTSAVLTNSPGASGKDANGNYYVTTNSIGYFNITGDWTCTAGTDIYVYAVGGNPGGYGNNPNESLMGLLGNCSNVNSSTSVWMNEVTTVASVYALSGFMSSPTQVASASTTASIAGMAAAFATYTNLVNNATGTAYTTTPGSTTAVTGTVSTANINTLADILAACENSTGGVNNDGSVCGSLFYYSTPSGGIAATNTTQAALNIVHNPAIDPNGDLYGLISTTPPFQPYLSQTPYDWTLPIVFSGGGMNNLYDIAVDGNNNIWAISDGKNGDCAVLSADTGSDVVELTNLGVAKSGSNGYTNADIECPFAIAIDTSNQAWVVSDYVNYLAKISTTGTVTGYTKTGDIDYGNGIAFDASGNIFVTNYLSSYVSKYVPSSNTWATYSGAGLTTSGSGVSWGIAADANGHIFVASDASSGRVDAFTDKSGVLTALTTSSGYTGAGITYPLRLAVDQNNNVWVANFGASAATSPGSTLSEFSVSGSTLTAASGSPFSGGGLYAPFGLAVDGSNNIWVADAAAYGVSEFANNGTAISPYYGFIGTIASPTTAAMYFPEAVAIDESGNVWVANYGVNTGTGVGTTAQTVAGSITELVGAATPVLTPISAATAAGTPAAKP